MITSTIYCYHEFLGSAAHDATVNLWRRYWNDSGWVTYVRGIEDAQRHPDYHRYVKHVDKFPTVNNRDFERACYVRWLAFSMAPTDKPFAVSDSDVFPRVPFPPREFKTFFNGSPERGPGFIVGTRNDYQKIVEAIWSFIPREGDKLPDGRPHISDMVILQARKELFEGFEFLIDCYTRRDWQNVPLVHFGNEYLSRRYPKHVEIAKVLSMEKQRQIDCRNL